MVGPGPRERSIFGKNPMVDRSATTGQFQAYLLHHHYTESPLVEDDRIFAVQNVEVKVNGRPMIFLVDTGCEKTSVTAAAARYLKLAVHDLNHSGLGVGGQIKGSEGVAPIESFAIANAELNRLNLVWVLSEGAHLEGNVEGVLGFDYMHYNAMIYPVGRSGFFFKPGPTPVVSIASFMEQLGYKPFPLSIHGGDLVVNGHLNGHPVVAVVDSGASNSVFDLDFVQKFFGNAMTYLPSGGAGADGRVLDTNKFKPDEFDLEGVRMSPIAMVAAKTPVFSKVGITGLLGFDFLIEHYAIIDMGSDILWLK
jgi:hypothetical protein